MTRAFSTDNFLRWTLNEMDSSAKWMRYAAFICVCICLVSQYTVSVTVEIDTCDGNGMTVNVSDYAAYDSGPYLQHNSSELLDHICGTASAEGNITTCDASNCTILLSYEYMLDDMCGAFDGTNFTSRMIIPKRQTLEMRTDYVVDLTCYWKEYHDLNDTEVLSQQNRVWNATASFQGSPDLPEIAASLLLADGNPAPGSIALGDGLILKVEITETVSDLWQHLQITGLVAYTEGKVATYDIIGTGGCVTLDAAADILAEYPSDATESPMLLDFKSFRFWEDPEVNFEINVRVCVSNKADQCVRSCSGGRRRREALSRNTRDLKERWGLAEANERTTGDEEPVEYSLNLRTLVVSESNVISVYDDYETADTNVVEVVGRGRGLEPTEVEESNLDTTDLMRPTPTKWNLCLNTLQVAALGCVFILLLFISSCLLAVGCFKFRRSRKWQEKVYEHVPGGTLHKGSSASTSRTTCCKGTCSNHRSSCYKSPGSVSFLNQEASKHESDASSARCGHRGSNAHRSECGDDTRSRGFSRSESIFTPAKVYPSCSASIEGSRRKRDSLAYSTHDRQ